DADPCQQPQPEHLLEIGGIGCRKREDAEPQVRADERGLAAIAITDPSENGRAGEYAKEARAQHRPERAAFEPPGLHEVGRGERNRRDVVSVDENNEQRPDQELDLKRAEPALVEQTRDLHLLTGRHSILPRDVLFLWGPTEAQRCVQVKLGGSPVYSAATSRTGSGSGSRCALSPRSQICTRSR